MRISLLLFLLLWTPLAAVAQPHYLNPRYGFSVDLPAGFKAMAPPENGDGQAYESSDKKGKITVYGSNNISEDSLQAAEAAHQSACPSKISYRARGKNWFVHSWSSGARISYLKCFIGKGATNSMLVEYPKAQAGAYDGVVKKLESTFKPGDLSQSH